MVVRNGSSTVAKHTANNHSDRRDSRTTAGAMGVVSTVVMLVKANGVATGVMPLNVSGVATGAVATGAVLMVVMPLKVSGARATSTSRLTAPSFHERLLLPTTLGGMKALDLSRSSCSSISWLPRTLRSPQKSVQSVPRTMVMLLWPCKMALPPRDYSRCTRDASNQEIGARDSCAVAQETSSSKH